MTLKVSINNVLRIFLLDEKAIHKVSKNRAATSAAVAVLAITAIIIGHFQIAYDMKLPNNYLATPIFVALFIFLTTIILTGIVHFFATRLKGKGSFLQLFRVVGLQSAVTLFHIIPFIGPVLSRIWSILIEYRAIKAIYGLSSKRALGVIVLSLFSYLLLMVLIGFHIAKPVA